MQKRPRARSLVAFVGWLCWWSTGQARADTVCDLSVSGAVVRADTGAPLRFVRIQLVATASTGEVRAALGVDGEGRFMRTGLCPGSVRIEVQSPGYVPLRRALAEPLPDLRLELVRVGANGPPDVAEGDEAVINIDASALDTAVVQTRTVDRIAGEKIDAMRGKDLAGFVESVNGGRTLGSGNYAKPILRGQNGPRVTIIQNGSKHASQSWGLDHAPEIDPFAAAEVTVVQGAAGVEFGSESIGGVVILEPPKPPALPGVEASADLVGATNNRLLAGSLSVRTRLPGDFRGLTLRLQSSFTRSSNYQTPTYDLDNTATEIFGLSAGVGYEWGSSKIEASYDLYDAFLGVYTGFQSANLAQFNAAREQGVPFQIDNFEQSYDIDRPFQDVVHDTARLRWTQSLTDSSTLTVAYSFQRDQREERDRVRARLAARPQVGFDLEAHDVSATLAGAFGGSFEVKGGGELRVENSDFFGTTRLIADYRAVRGGAFGLLRVVEEAYELELGMRFDAQSLQSDQAQRIDPRGRPRIEREFDFAAVTVTGGAIIPLAPEWTLRAQLASAARMPAINELTIDGGSPGIAVFIVGNEQLDTEDAYEGSVDLSASTEYFDLSASVFASYISDYIYFSPGLNPVGNPRVEVTAQGPLLSFEYTQIDAAFIGTNLQAGLRPFPFLEWRGRVSVIRGENVTADTGLQLVPPDRVENRLTLRSTNQWGPLVDTFFFVEHVFNRRQDNFDIRQDFDPPPDAYHLVNAGLGLGWKVDDQIVRLSVEGFNLLDQSYRDYLSRLRYFADEPGRNITVRLHVPVDAGF